MSTRIKNHYELLSTETIVTRCTVFIYEYFINSIGSNHNVVIHVSNNPIKLRFRQKRTLVMNIPLDLKCFRLSSTALYVYIFYFNYTIFVLFRNPKVVRLTLLYILQRSVWLVIFLWAFKFFMFTSA